MSVIIVNREDSVAKVWGTTAPDNEHVTKVNKLLNKCL
ncbi:Uncharacterised protein [Vibrio cholerae]|nr:hypothetical protein VS84_00163 [Vibrio cholerae]KKP22052.1 hypothetical protein VS86_00551 [Vibrio cholerae]CSB66323.1 Uncharacterised protein [Vibrio cholerae]CSI08244.1 Uncharacterised protein [Vibrio cholerae]